VSPADPGIRLRRSHPNGPGIRRRRCGRGFRYLGPGAQPVRDPETLARIKALVIPPAWEDVWICAEPGGHIQAVGTDAAGRRQYRYHDLWRERQDRDKHDRVMEFGRILPRLRKTVTAADINGYLAEISAGEFTAKDFRTWHATVLAAVGLAVSEHAAATAAARKRAIARAVAEVAGYLGNTPAVARASYIDPRVIELYESGITIAPALRDLGRNSEFGDLATRGAAERAVVRMLTRHG
jgi:DNA topoisomerase IB